MNLLRPIGRFVADGGEPEQVGGQFRVVRVEDERASDAKCAAEQPGLEHHIVARRGLGGLGSLRSGPVVLSEHKHSEIDLLRKLH